MGEVHSFHRPGRKVKPTAVFSVAVGRGWVDGGVEPTFQISWMADRAGKNVIGGIELDREEARRIAASLTDFVNKTPPPAK